MILVSQSEISSRFVLVVIPISLCPGVAVGSRGELVTAAYPTGLRRDEAVAGLPVAHIMGFAVLIGLAFAIVVIGDDDEFAGGLAIVLTTHDLNGIAAHLPEIVCLNREVIAAEVAAEGFSALKGRRVGAIVNPTSVDSHFRHLADLLVKTPGVVVDRSVAEQFAEIGVILLLFGIG